MGVISNKAKVIERWGQEKCDICGEPFTLKPTEEVAEWYDPGDGINLHYIAHAQCGIDKGFELA